MRSDRGPGMPPDGSRGVCALAVDPERFDMELSPVVLRERNELELPFLLDENPLGYPAELDHCPLPTIVSASSSSSSSSMVSLYGFSSVGWFCMKVNSVALVPPRLLLSLRRAPDTRSSRYRRRWTSICCAHFRRVSSVVNLMMKFSMLGSPFQKIWHVYEPRFHVH